MNAVGKFSQISLVKPYKHRNDIIDVVFVALLLNLNIFHTFF